jgi:hypothetical protein
MVLAGMYDPDRAARKLHDELPKLAGRWLSHVERRLASRAWIACADFTVADHMLASVLRYIRKTVLLQPYPVVKDFDGAAWSDRRGSARWRCTPSASGRPWTQSYRPGGVARGLLSRAENARMTCGPCVRDRASMGCLQPGRKRTSPPSSSHATHQRRGEQARGVDASGSSLSIHAIASVSGSERRAERMATPDLAPLTPSRPGRGT